MRTVAVCTSGIIEMAFHELFKLLVLTLLTLAATAHPGGNKRCKFIPGDAGWPSRKDWQQLNRTVHGRLIATTPLGQVCHDKGHFGAYDEAACAKLKTDITQSGPQILYVETHPQVGSDVRPNLILNHNLSYREAEPGDILNPYFQSLTCSPFTPADDACELGERAVYSIDVRQAEDVQAGFEFARKKNVRLVVKNTGIEYV